MSGIAVGSHPSKSPPVSGMEGMDLDGLADEVQDDVKAVEQQDISVEDPDAKAAVREQVRKLANDTGIDLGTFCVDLESLSSMVEACDYMTGLLVKAARGETIFRNHGLSGKAEAAAADAGADSANGNGAKGGKGGSGKQVKAKEKFQENGGVKKTSGNSGMPGYIKFGLSRSEYGGRMQRGVCLYCNGEGHRVGECPEADNASKGLPSSAGNKPAVPISFKKKA